MCHFFLLRSNKFTFQIYPKKNSHSTDKKMKFTFHYIKKNNLFQKKKLCQLTIANNDDN